MSWWSWQDHNWTATLPSWNNLKVKTLWLNPNLLMTPISPHFVNQISSFIYFEVPDSGKWQRMPDDDKDCDNDESIFTSKTTFCLLRSVTKLWLDWMSCTLATLKLNLSLSLYLSFSLFLSLSLFFQHVDSSPRNATTAFKKCFILMQTLCSKLWFQLTPSKAFVRSLAI